MIGGGKPCLGLQPSPDLAPGNSGESVATCRHNACLDQPHARWMVRLFEPTGVYWLVSVTIDQCVDTAAPTTCRRGRRVVRITVRLGGADDQDRSGLASFRAMPGTANDVDQQGRCPVKGRAYGRRRLFGPSSGRDSSLTPRLPDPLLSRHLPSTRPRLHRL